MTLSLTITVGETGGKNMHFIHHSADPANVAIQTIRSAFEFQGQKCSACSRVYCPDNLWPRVKEALLTEHSKLKVGPVEGKEVCPFFFLFYNIIYFLNKFQI